MLYEVLNQRNPHFKATQWETIDDLYDGGFTMAEKARKYLRKRVNEHDERYEERVANASYINYFGVITNAYVSALFQREVQVVAPSDTKIDDFWADFAKNADLRGNTFSRVLRNAFLSLILKRRALIAYDFPFTTPAETRVEEDANGTHRAYAWNVDVEELIDWKHSDTIRRVSEIKAAVPGKDGKRPQVTFELGRFEWCILKSRICERNSPGESRGTYRERFKIWKRDGDRVVWEIYETANLKDSETPRPKDEIPLKDSGTVSFGHIPLVELKVPKGLWLGNALATMALEHFRRRSALVASEDRALLALACFFLGPELKSFKGEQASVAQQDPNRASDPRGKLEKQGYIVLGKDDKAEYLEPEGKAFEVVDRQLNELVDAMYRVACQMAQSVTASTTGLARSGQSKQEDRHAMEVLLGAYAEIVSGFAVFLYDDIGRARKDEPVAWSVHGLDGYDQIDRTLLISEAKDLVGVDIPSATFRAQYKTQLALDLLQCPPEVQEQIRKEIAEAEAKAAIEREKATEEPQDPSVKPDAKAEGDNETDDSADA